MKLTKFNGQFFKDFWKIVFPYWKNSEDKWFARGILALILGLDFGMVFISYKITEW